MVINSTCRTSRSFRSSQEARRPRQPSLGRTRYALARLFVGILITNIADMLKRPLEPMVVERFGAVALNTFLAMSMMSIQLWTLAGAGMVVMVVLIKWSPFAPLYGESGAMNISG